MPFQARLPRFRRAAHQSVPFQFTPRDLTILEHVAKHRFLRSTHIVALLDGSRQQILRRLQLLYHHGYLDRPRAQLDYFHAGGSSPFVYGLASRGAGRLRRDLDMPFDKMEWAGRKKSVGRVFLDHALLISDFMVALEVGCRGHGKVRFIPKPEIALPPRTASSKQPFRWNVPNFGAQKLSVIPDQAFALEFIDQPREPKRVLFLMEADRGTMPVVRANKNFTSFARKLSAYEATWKNGIHRTRFGFERMRVLTVTTGASRTSRILDECRKLSRGRGLFLFAEIDALLSNPDLLSHRWLAGDGQRQMTLLD